MHINDINKVAEYVNNFHEAHHTPSHQRLADFCHIIPGINAVKYASAAFAAAAVSISGIFLYDYIPVNREMREEYKHIKKNLPSKEREAITSDCTRQAQKHPDVSLFGIINIPNELAAYQNCMEKAEEQLNRDLQEKYKNIFEERRSINYRLAPEIAVGLSVAFGFFGYRRAEKTREGLLSTVLDYENKLEL
ncbi:MAG: hypothetical protein H6855_00085 [Rhodospirillales bacterium]|nr:hypothetical protein [Rhodospirillales bacterium]